MNGFMAFLGRSLRGARLVQFCSLMVLLAMVLGVYLAKASAGRERGDITAVQQQIDDEQRKLRLLQAEVAHLEEPQRMERLSAMIGLAPTSAKHERGADELRQIAQNALVPDKGPHKPAAASVSTFTPPGNEAPAVTR